jgi:hypothetical protein
MFWTKRPSLLDFQIDKAIRALNGYEIGSEEYVKILDTLSTLYKMKEENTSSVSKDTLAVIGANLLGILLIIQHENVNVITSKAMNLVMKPRA